MKYLQSKQWRQQNNTRLVFVVNFQQISQLVLMFLLLTLNTCNCGSFQILIKCMIQFVTFHMNPKSTNVTLGCIISIFDMSVASFTGETYIRIWRNTHLVTNLIGNWLMKTVTVASYWCAMRIHEFPCGLGIGSMEKSSNMIYKDNKLLKTKNTNLNITYVSQKIK